jgi:hypothetical protein
MAFLGGGRRRGGSPFINTYYGLPTYILFFERKDDVLTITP